MQQRLRLCDFASIHLKSLKIRRKFVKYMQVIALRLWNMGTYMRFAISFFLKGQRRILVKGTAVSFIRGSR
jgi:hypothetical protein